jgi:hypothetical protein
MKMAWDWQVFIKFILFAMLVVAFTFAIWSYVKTNAIKNSESPSISNFINDNNTYVNNIASAPNVVFMGSNGLPNSYTLKSTDNGSDILLWPDPLDTPEDLTITLPKDPPFGFYVKAINVNNNPVTINFIDDGMNTHIILASYEWAYYISQGSFITNTNTSGESRTGAVSNGTYI